MKNKVMALGYRIKLRIEFINRIFVYSLLELIISYISIWFTGNFFIESVNFLAYLASSLYDSVFQAAYRTSIWIVY